MFRRIVALMMATGCGVPMASLANAESFICKSEISTGFKWSGSKWAYASFDVSNETYLVEPDGGISSYSVTKIGDKSASHSDCEKIVLGKVVTDRIRCGGIVNSFLLDTNTLRFQEFYGFGYLDAKDASGDTPFFTLGSCSRMR